tara:strand:- start:1735 stop:1944 length:210 start_codon:yes stop_codon:yes gene_type:complete
MPYHVKTPSKVNVGDVYWKGDNSWTNDYASRKQFSSKSDADAVKATTVTSPQGVTYQPRWFADATVVTE